LAGTSCQKTAVVKDHAGGGFWLAPTSLEVPRASRRFTTLQDADPADLNGSSLRKKEDQGARGTKEYKQQGSSRGLQPACLAYYVLDVASDGPRDPHMAASRCLYSRVGPKLPGPRPPTSFDQSLRGPERLRRHARGGPPKTAPIALAPPADGVPDRPPSGASSRPLQLRRPTYRDHTAKRPTVRDSSFRLALAREPSGRGARRVSVAPVFRGIPGQERLRPCAECRGRARRTACASAGARFCWRVSAGRRVTPSRNRTPPAE